MLRKSLLLFITLLLLSANRCILAQEAAPPVAQPSIPPLIAAPDNRPAPTGSAASVEHWDKPALRDNDLHADRPLAGELDTFPDFTRELLRVQWRGADPIDLYIVRPTGVAKPPVVIYLYGYPGEAVRFLNNNLCRTVTQGGVAAVGFSSMLTGQRYHDVPMKEWFVSDLQRSLAGSAHDVQMLLNYLASRGDFDMTRVGIFGEGSGGTIALLAASVDPRIKAVDLLNPWGDWPSWLAASRVVPDRERANYLKPDFLQSVAPYDPVNLLPKFTSTPLRLQQNLWDDTITPTASRERTAAAMPPGGELAQYKTQQEYVDKVGSNGKMLDWMYTHLPPPAPATPAPVKKAH